MAALSSLALAAALAASTAAAASPIDRWAGPIAEASARFGIPEAWIRRVIRAESGGRLAQDRRPIVSSAGALGLMQLMPATWSDMRSLLGLGDDPQDPHDNILAGSFYLRLMYDRFGYPGLFAAYNAGPARYAASLDGGPPLPRETRAYVARLAPAGRATILTPHRVENRTLALFAIVPARDAAPSAFRTRGEKQVGAANPLRRAGPLFAIADGSGR